VVGKNRLDNIGEVLIIEHKDGTLYRAIPSDESLQRDKKKKSDGEFTEPKIQSFLNHETLLYMKLCLK
jgi:hypothetical protein